jgi:membrane-bound inhibitor of C-type lysozyme
MATSLLDGLKGLVTPELLSTAARSVGASEGSIATGLGASFPTILAGLAGKAGNAQAIRPFFDLISSPANDGSVLTDPRLAVTAAPESPLGAVGAKLLSGLFGSQLSSVGDVITRAAGLRSGSGGSLLRMAAPLVLGLLGDRVRSGGLSPTGLTSLLLGERDQIVSALPAGLGSILSLKEIGRHVDVGVAAPRGSTTEARRPGRRWFWPALAALALIGVLWALSRYRRPAVDQTVGAVTGVAADADDTLAAAVGDLRFHCGDQRITLGQSRDRTVLTTDAGTFDLRRVEAASGAKYEAFSDDSTTFWSRGDRATLTIRGKSYPECTRDR